MANGEDLQPLSLDEACTLVGRFFFEFARMERAVDKALSALFALSDDSANVLIPKIDISRKLNILRSTKTLRSVGSTDATLAVFDKFISDIYRVNERYRRNLAHLPFDVDASGSMLIGGKEAPSGELVGGQKITREEFNQSFEIMRHISAGIQESLSVLIKIDAVKSLKEMPNSALRAAIANLVSRMREFEAEQRTKDCVVDWEPGWQARAMARSEERLAAWQSGLLPEASALLDETRSRLGLPKFDRYNLSLSHQDMALFAIDEGSLAGANPLGEAATAMERLARELDERGEPRSATPGDETR